jgi:hypothetical protein
MTFLRRRRRYAVEVVCPTFFHNGVSPSGAGMQSWSCADSHDIQEVVK